MSNDNNNEKDFDSISDLDAEDFESSNKKSGDLNSNQENDEDDFKPTETVQESAKDEKYLNKNFGYYIPKAAIYTITILFIGIGFILGFGLGNLIIGGIFCGLEMMTQLTADPTAVSGGGDLVEGLQSEFTRCTTRSIFTPIPLISGFILGSILAYPGYKLSKSVSKGKHLRSII